MSLAINTDQNIPALYLKQIESIHAQLGIAWERIIHASLPLYMEASHLISIGLDPLGRTQYLTPKAAISWEKMRHEARTEGVELSPISGFRSMIYQTFIIEKKLNSGQRIEDILTINAPPGFSEHHSGRALDIGTPSCENLHIDFEKTDAFQWLLQNASDFHFELSYPENNTYGIIYEPWHWCYQNHFS